MISRSPKEEKAFVTAFTLASWLSDPLDHAHRLYRKTLIVENLSQKIFLILWAFLYTLFSLVTTPCAIAIRFIAISLQSRPFIYLRGNRGEKEIENNEISLFSWNICAVWGGYSITDGGILPWRYRIDPILEQVCRRDADVVCLQEVFDIKTTRRLMEGLQDRYTHFYINIGPNTIGAASAMFVASKVKLAEPEFTPFPQAALVGRSKYAKKGFFSFYVQRRNGENFAKIFHTHLGHSEIPNAPTKEEQNARAMQMSMIMSAIQNVEVPCILTGDLNMDREEFHHFDWFERLEEDEMAQGFTWGGDQYCSNLMGKVASDPKDLNYTMVLKDRGVTIHTQIVEPEDPDQVFEGGRFKPHALSDHKGLFSIIKVI